jgi:phytol kinase
MNHLLAFLILSAAGGLLFYMVEWLYNTKKWHVEFTRNIAHIGGGLLALSLPVFLKNQWWALLLCGMFQFVMVVTHNSKYLRSIHGVKRKTYGSMAYPIAIFLVFMIWYHSENFIHEPYGSNVYFNLPVLILALCDPIATYFGYRYRTQKIKGTNKSISGFLAFFILACILSILVLQGSHLFHNRAGFASVFFIALVAAITELYSKKGLDNLFIPISVLLAMYIAEHFFN